MLRRHARTLAVQLKELLLAFVDSSTELKSNNAGSKKSSNPASAISQRILDSVSVPVLEMTPRRSTASFVFVRLRTLARLTASIWLDD
jgi:hypothetical protein